MMITDKEKVYIDGKEMDRVYVGGELVYRGAIDLSNQNLWEMGFINGTDGVLMTNTSTIKGIRTKDYIQAETTSVTIEASGGFEVYIFYYKADNSFVGRAASVENSTVNVMVETNKIKFVIYYPDSSTNITLQAASTASVKIRFN